MKKLMFIGILLLGTIWSNQAEGNAVIEAAFTPSYECEQKIISYIHNSSVRIDIAVYAINNKAITKALKSAFDRGVKLRILTDRLQASRHTSTVKELFRYGINIKVHSKYKVEHNKFAIFDQKIIATGSYNWTDSASRSNSENCIFITEDQHSLQKYQRRFNYLWQVNTAEKSLKWFRKHQINLQN